MMLLLFKVIKLKQNVILHHEVILQVFFQFSKLVKKDKTCKKAGPHGNGSSVWLRERKMTG